VLSESKWFVLNFDWIKSIISLFHNIHVKISKNIKILSAIPGQLQASFEKNISHSNFKVHSGVNAQAFFKNHPNNHINAADEIISYNNCNDESKAASEYVSYHCLELTKLVTQVISHIFAPSIAIATIHGALAQARIITHAITHTQSVITFPGS